MLKIYSSIFYTLSTLSSFNPFHKHNFLPSFPLPLSVRHFLFAFSKFPTAPIGTLVVQEICLGGPPLINFLGSCFWFCSQLSWQTVPQFLPFRFQVTLRLPDFISGFHLLISLTLFVEPNDLSWLGVSIRGVFGPLKSQEIFIHPSKRRHTCACWLMQTQCYRSLYSSCTTAPHPKNPASCIWSVP